MATTDLAMATIFKADHHMVAKLSEATKDMAPRVTKAKEATDKAIQVKESTDFDQDGLCHLINLLRNFSNK